MNTLEKCAEILVESGYAYGITRISSIPLTVTRKDEPKGESMFAEVNPFADTLEGRRQADEIEDWLKSDISRPRFTVWVESGKTNDVSMGDNCHQWRLDRIKWCIEQLLE
mgnify:CR=1 FL=1